MTEPSQVTLHGMVVLAVSAPRLPRAQHPCVLEVRSQDAPLVFKSILKIVYFFYAIEAVAEKKILGNSIIFSSLSLVLAVTFVYALPICEHTKYS